MANAVPQSVTQLAQTNGSVGSPIQTQPSIIAPGPVIPPPSADTDHVYVAQLAPVDGSQAGGFAVVAVQGDQLTVDIHASGVTAFAAHPQTIESAPPGFEDVFPLVSQPTTGNAVPLHGGVLFTLTQSGDIQSPTPFNLALFPHADANGVLDFTQTFGPQGPSTTGFPSLENTELVIYGHPSPTATGQYLSQAPAAIGFLHEITPHFLAAAEINGATGSETQAIIG